MSEAGRFWSKVDKSDPSGCWLWNGCTDAAGYGQVGWREDGRVRHAKAHRWAYEASIGPIPEGLQLDHLCRNPRCVNPDHLEPVTNRENTRRGRAGEVNAARQRAKTHCPKGHSLADPYIDSRGWRGCRECRNESARQFKIRRAS